MLKKNTAEKGNCCWQIPDLHTQTASERTLDVKSGKKKRCLNKKQLRFILEEQKKEKFVFGLGEPNIIQRGKPFFKKILFTLRPRAKRNKQNMDTILK